MDKEGEIDKVREEIIKLILDIEKEVNRLEKIKNNYIMRSANYGSICGQILVYNAVLSKLKIIV